MYALLRRGCRLRRIGIALVVIGAVVFLVSLSADLTGISGDAGFQVGPRQVGGMVLGVVVLLVGVVLGRGRRKS